jgi:hypothetical protein
MSIFPHRESLNTKERHFDTRNGQFLTGSTILSSTNGVPSDDTCSIPQICESLCVPMKYIGSLVRIAGEAKAFCECTMVASKIQKAWSLFTLSVAALHFSTQSQPWNLNGNVLLNGEKNNDPFVRFHRHVSAILLDSNQELNALEPLLNTISTEQQLAIRRLFEKLKQWFSHLANIREKLANFADLNASLATEFMHQQSEKLAQEKMLLSNIELAMVSRIDWLLSGCIGNRAPDMSKSWEEMFGQQNSMIDPTGKNSNDKEMSTERSSKKRVAREDEALDEKEVQTVGRQVSKQMCKKQKLKK